MLPKAFDHFNTPQLKIAHHQTTCSTTFRQKNAINSFNSLNNNINNNNNIDGNEDDYENDDDEDNENDDNDNDYDHDYNENLDDENKNIESELNVQYFNGNVKCKLLAGTEFTTAVEEASANSAQAKKNIISTLGNTKSNGNVCTHCTVNCTKCNSNKCKKSNKAISKKSSLCSSKTSTPGSLRLTGPVPRYHVLTQNAHNKLQITKKQLLFKKALELKSKSLYGSRHRNNRMIKSSTVPTRKNDGALRRITRSYELIEKKCELISSTKANSSTLVHNNVSNGNSTENEKSVALSVQRSKINHERKKRAERRNSLQQKLANRRTSNSTINKAVISSCTGNETSNRGKTPSTTKLPLRIESTTVNSNHSLSSGSSSGKNDPSVLETGSPVSASARENSHLAKNGVLKPKRIRLVKR